MANTIKLRRSATTGAVPTTTQLALGEVAINTYDGKVFIKKDDGTESIVEVGGGKTPPEITWTLTANGSSDYIFSGDGFPTSQNDPTLYLMRGQTYKFVNNTGAHPFRIQSTGATSGGGTQYNSGVTNQDAGNGDTHNQLRKIEYRKTLLVIKNQNQIQYLYCPYLLGHSL